MFPYLTYINVIKVIEEIITLSMKFFPVFSFFSMKSKTSFNFLIFTFHVEASIFNEAELTIQYFKLIKIICYITFPSPCRVSAKWTSQTETSFDHFVYRHGVGRSSQISATRIP